MPVISKLRGRGKKEELKFQASLSYIVSSRKVSTGYTVRLVSSNKIQRAKQLKLALA